MPRASLVLLIWVVLFLDGKICAQSLSVVPVEEWKKARQRVEAAESAWTQANQSLEKDILKKQPQVVLDQLDEVTRLTSILQQERERYYQLRIGEVESEIRELERPSRLPGLSNQVSEQQSMAEETLQKLVREEARLKEQIRDIPAGSREVLVQEQLKRQLNSIAGLERELKQQISQGQEASQAGALLDQTRQSILGSSRQLLSVLAEQSSLVQNKYDLWKSYYDALRAMVKAHESKESKVANSKEEKSAPAVKQEAPGKKED